ncbi:type II methionyl aminopeptidase [Candidatus Pacearchaeota archaeon CG10_big_fil_rev_8_21_14_0_10_32_42]|nr:MAG: type II methionyl aminopeptidase [Candidatus Pacearchaeota archaeon CG10_big_fil_rev_8_21_14_0_10_32_42]
MTEKQYGGQTGRENNIEKIRAKNITPKTLNKKINNINKIDEQSESNLGGAGRKTSISEKIILAGKIASQVKSYAKSFIKKDIPLLEIAEKIESKILEFGGKPAFPTNLSINQIAAHYTPSHDDKTLASGLLKVDFGVHIDGWIADTAFSLDLENSEENKKLIQASEKALESTTKIIKENILTSEIGNAIQKTIESFGFSPIINLSGHEMKQHELHAGLTIPNINDKRNIIIKKGLYAIEPFATNGDGKVYNGKPSGIYMLTNTKNVRSPIARELLEFIEKEYKTLPFCSRWLVKKFGTKALFGLKQLEENQNLHHFPQLIESSHSKVSQAEDTVLIDEKVIVTTR